METSSLLFPRDPDFPSLIHVLLSYGLSVLVQRTFLCCISPELVRDLGRLHWRQWISQLVESEEGKCYLFLMRVSVTLTVKSLPNQCQCHRWPEQNASSRDDRGTRLLLGPRFSFTPLVSSENEIELGLLTFDIPVSHDQPLASLGDQHSSSSSILHRAGWVHRSCSSPRLQPLYWKKLGALSPEMWGEPGLRRLPCCVMFASSFPSGREKSKLGWGSSFLASAACQIGHLLFCLPFWLILRF